jgi:hypothetical protein
VARYDPLAPVETPDRFTLVMNIGSIRSAVRIARDSGRRRSGMPKLAETRDGGNTPAVW